MGMSASQARLLSLTSRMHDLEYQAQTIENAKLSLSDASQVAYEQYEDEINSSKYQISAFSATSGTTKVDLTFNNMIASGSIPGTSSYILTDSKTGNIYLPEQITKKFDNGSIPNTLNQFLQIVANNYIYSGENYDENTAVNKMKQDGYSDYWTSVYYQIAGYTDNEGNSYNGHGYESVSTSSASDRDWLKKQIDDGNVIINKMQSTQIEVNTDAVNIFAQTNIATDEDLSETEDSKRISKAENEYEHNLDEIDEKEKKLDLQLSRIENERNALKTEYDTVKDLVKKNIERSYKTFNA